ncbi:MAG: cysteine desulfurase-like protein [Planctomycetaceae bacterium]|nr:cysteine desulfurase-like protein [Planctomycetales bacterium]MCB9921189.1 cysteine desulfurase-like protein [Planctomycetaceae bacterium]
MTLMELGHQVTMLRQQFPSLSRLHRGQPVAYLDGPAGTQVPQRVIDAISDYLSHRNANHGGLFATSRESDAMLDEAHRAAVDLLGAGDSDCVYFGPNMTTLTFALSRALARTWKPGDEIVVTRLDHDANVTPWVLAAKDADATVQYVDFHRQDCTLDMDDLRSKLSDRTRLVAVGCASNSTGNINPVREICAAAHQVGALAFLDAVHFAPHALIDIAEFGCDFLACSAYKFFGPHIGIMWGRRELLENLTPYKLRPATNELPGKWMTGTQNHECIAGVLAAIDYLADLGRDVVSDQTLDRRSALSASYKAVGDYERSLVARLLAGLEANSEVKVWGITDPERFAERLPTVSITHRRLRPIEIAERLDQKGIFVWHGNYYALQITETLGLEPDGMVRIGLVHYNTEDEIDRLLLALNAL